MITIVFLNIAHLEQKENFYKLFRTFLETFRNFFPNAMVTFVFFETIEKGKKKKIKLHN